MFTVRLHAQAGKMWALFRCSVCGEVQKRTVRDARSAPLACKRCGSELDIAGEVAEAEERRSIPPGLPQRPSLSTRGA